MLRLFTVLSLLIGASPMYAQNNVFVLVDVSKSVTQTDLNNAKQALTEVLTGLPLSRAFVAQGSQSDLANFKLVAGDKLAVVKFGSLQTTLAINPAPSQIQNVDADVSQVLNSSVWTPTDHQTYLTLAKAKIAEYAKSNNIANYKLCLISDNLNDDYGQGGKPNYPDDYTRNLVEGYNSSTNPVIEGGYTRLKFEAGSFFALSVSSVDVSKYNLPPATSPLPPVPGEANPVIAITSPPEAKKGKEHEIKSEMVNVNWSCRNSPKGIKYTVSVSQYDGGKFRETKKDLTTNTATFKVPDGKFRITVSASNFSVSPDYTCIDVSTGSYGWFIFLAVLAAVVVGYYCWDKKRAEKINPSAATFKGKGDDLFSAGNRGTTSSSSHSDYF